MATDSQNRSAHTDTPERACRFCGGSLAGRDFRSEFCSPTHKDLWWRKARTRGGQAYSLLMEWRSTRGKRKGLLGDLAWMVDQWIAEDREAVKKEAPAE